MVLGETILRATEDSNIKFLSRLECVGLVLRNAIAGLKLERGRRLKRSQLSFFYFRAFFLVPLNPSF